MTFYFLKNVQFSTHRPKLNLNFLQISSYCNTQDRTSSFRSRKAGRKRARVLLEVGYGVMGGENTAFGMAVEREITKKVSTNW